MLVVRLVVGLIFLVSAASKVSDFRAFVATLAEYRVLPGRAVRPAAYAVVLGEAMVALGMASDLSARYAAWLAILLLLAFSVAIAVNLARGRTDIDCGCFGPLLRQGLSWWLVARNGVLMLVAGLAALPGHGLGGFGWLEWLTATTGAGALVMLYLSVGHILASGRYGG